METIYKNYVKCVIDFLFSFFVLLFLAPFFLIIILVLLIANGKSGVFFLHERPGKNGKLFKVIKFKTMTDEKDKNGKMLPDVDRLTRVGKIVRSLSIDELPQFINILKGDMSFVGPRPLMTKYLPLYTPFQNRRHKVRPGITGWAQVNGRNDISWQRKFELDVWYVDHISFLLDVNILLMTFKKVIKREGIVKQGCATTEPFNGLN